MEYSSSLLRSKESARQPSVTSVSPEEAALSIDHIREIIFGSLDHQSLLDCRLVCHRWAVYASKEFQNTTILEFNESKCCPSFLGKIFRTPQSTSFLQKQNPHRSLETLVQNHYESNNIEFPCTTFIFMFEHSKILTSTHFQSFVDSDLGYNTKKLTLFNINDFGIDSFNFLNEDPSFAPSTAASTKHKTRGCYPRKNSSGRTSSLLLEDVENMILCKMPNLVELVIKDPQLTTSKLNALDEQRPQFVNLTRLQFIEPISKEVLDYFLKSSPNLREVELHVKNLSLLLQPINGLSLLKTISADINKETLELLNTFGDVILNCEEKIKIRQLDLFGTFNLIWDGNLIPRAINTINKILSGCSKTCETLVWDEIGLLENLEIPIMPKVECLVFKIISSLSRADDSMFSPLNLRESFSVKFPNLKNIFVLTNEYHGTDCDWQEIIPPCRSIFEDLKRIRLKTSWPKYGVVRIWSLHLNEKYYKRLLGEYICHVLYRLLEAFPCSKIYIWEHNFESKM